MHPADHRSDRPSPPATQRRPAHLRGCGLRAAGRLLVAGSLTALCSWAAAQTTATADRSPASPALEAAAAAPTRIAVHEFSWTDRSRQRDLPARLYWPADAVADAPLPLVVFSHGLGGSRMGYSHLGRHWAAQGYASLHLQHPGSDRALWSAGMFNLLANLQSAASDAQAIARAQDVSFGISAILAEPAFAARIDAARIAGAGHSYGANTALLVAGAQVQREVDGVWRTLDYRDPRVKAAVLLSTPPFYGEGDIKAILRAIRIPTLHVTGTQDVIRVPGYRSEPADRIAVFDALPGGPDGPPKVLAVFSGATHSIFTDRSDGAGPELNRVVKAATRELSTRFLDASLRGASFAGVNQWLLRQAGLLAQQGAVSLPVGP